MNCSKCNAELRNFSGAAIPEGVACVCDNCQPLPVIRPTAARSKAANRTCDRCGKPCERNHTLCPVCDEMGEQSR